MKPVRARRGGMAILLLGLALLLLGGVRPVHAQSATCDGTYGGLLNGNVQPTRAPNLLQIDGACTIENYPAHPTRTQAVSAG